MKRIYPVIAILLVFILGSCSNTKTDLELVEIESNLDMSSEFVINQNITLTPLGEESEGVFTGELVNGLPSGDGIFTSQNSDGIQWTYTGNWVDGHMSGNGKIEWIVVVQYHEGEYLDDTFNGYGELYQNGELVYEGVFEDGQKVMDASLSDTIETNEVTVKQDEEIIDQTLLTEYSTPETGDFFDDEIRQTQYVDLYKSYKYSDLADLVNEYIANNDPMSADSAYRILELIEPCLAYESQWLVTYDEFDQSQTITFPGATEISEQNSVCVTVKGTELNLKLGFQRSDWIFFDSIVWSADGEVIASSAYKSYNVETNVISDGIVEEFIFTSLYDKTITELSSSEIVILRFLNNDTKESYDHTLSQAEFDSIICGHMLQSNYKDLSNLLYQHNNPS